MYLVIWTYFGYPLFMYFLSKYFPTTHVVDDYQPTVTIIIPVANAPDKIFEKLYNTFGIIYPMTKFDVIVVMDGHCRETEAELRRFRTTFFQYSETFSYMSVPKGGKEAAQLAAVRSAVGEVIVFTDVATKFDAYTIDNIARHFSDPNVGAVDGMSKVVTDRHSNEGLYLQYENKIREWESMTSGLVTCGGCLFAGKATILQDTTTVNGKDYPGFVSDQQSDFRTPLMMRTNSLRTILDREAVAKFADGKPEREYARKHRTLVRGINVFMHNLHLLNIYKYGMFSYALFNHKLMKWLVPFFLITAYLSNMALAVESIGWSMVYIVHTLFYIIASLDLKNKVGKIMHFFLMTNIAIFNAWLSYAMGERFISWEPTKR